MMPSPKPQDAARILVPRRLYPSEHVRDLGDDTVLCKYMAFDPGLRSLVERQSLYLSSLERFKDTVPPDPLEGVTSLAEREATRESEVQKWYDNNKRAIFVTCFVVGEHELPYMWEGYAGGPRDGVLLKTTVGRLRAELSRPPCHGPELNFDVEADQLDGFTVGVVDYFDDEGIDLYQEMSQGLSKVRHVFRKRRTFEREREFRVALRAGSTTSEEALRANAPACLVGIEVANLVTEFRLKPGATGELREKVERLLREHNLHRIPVLDSSITVGA